MEQIRSDFIVERIRLSDQYCNDGHPLTASPLPRRGGDGSTNPAIGNAYIPRFVYRHPNLPVSTSVYFLPFFRTPGLLCLLLLMAEGPS